MFGLFKTSCNQGLKQRLHARATEKSKTLMMSLSQRDLLDWQAPCSYRYLWVILLNSSCCTQLTFACLLACRKSVAAMVAIETGGIATGLDTLSDGSGADNTDGSDRKWKLGLMSFQRRNIDGLYFEQNQPVATTPFVPNYKLFWSFRFIYFFMYLDIL